MFQIGGATGQIGDPSGRSKERSKLQNDIISHNLQHIREQLELLFANHEKYLCKDKISLHPIQILNNADWYREANLVEFISTYGRNFRIGQMVSRTSVQSRLKSESGMSFTEFTYQIFQAYDWYHLYKHHGCKFQLGGSDQTGNVMTGHEFISRMEKKPVFGLMLPLITTEEGDKFGKSAGNAMWLNESKTSPFALYQFFIRTPDSQVERLLKLFTFISVDEIDNLMKKHKQVPELRDAQKRLAEEVMLLVHGPTGLETAKNVTSALYNGNVEALGSLSPNDVRKTFSGATYTEIPLEPGFSILNAAMKMKCFPTECEYILLNVYVFLEKNNTKNNLLLNS